MALQFRQGPESDRASITPAQGEPIWITDTKQLYVGDGSTAGGIPITGGAGAFTSLTVTNTATVGLLKFTNDAYIAKGNTYDDVIINSTTASVRVEAFEGLIVGELGGLSNVITDHVQVLTDANSLFLQGGITVTNFDNTQTYAIINSNGSTHNGNYHNFGNTNATAQINSQGNGNLVLSAGSDAGMTGGLTLSSGNNGNVVIFGPGSRTISTLNTATITDVVQNRIDFDEQLLTYTDGTSQPLQIKSYNNGGAGIIETIMPMRHRGSKGSPASVQQGDGLSRYQSMPYTGAWADSNVFGFLSGSYFDGYSYGPEYAHVVSQDFNQSPLYWNHLEGFHQWVSFNPYDSAVHSTSTAQVNYVFDQIGNKLRTKNFEVGGSFGQLDSTVTLTPTKANGTEVPFTFNAATDTFTAPKTSATTATVSGMMTLPVYTSSALTAITGSVGQIAVVSNSAGGGNPNGMLAFWDTTNSRWSYVHSNGAV